MEVDLELFLDLHDLDASQVNELEDLLHPSNQSSEIEFPWNICCNDETFLKRGNSSSLNVHAPAFETSSKNIIIPQKKEISYPLESYSNGSNLTDVFTLSKGSHFHLSPEEKEKTQVKLPAFSNGLKHPDHLNEYLSYCQTPNPVNGEVHQEAHNPQIIQSPASSFKLNPTVSCFVPQNIRTYAQPEQASEDVQNKSAPLHETIPRSGTSSNRQQHHNELPALPRNFILPQQPKVQPHETSDKLELLSENLKDSNTQSVVTVSPGQNVVTVTSVSSTISPVSSAVTETSNTTDSPKVSSTTDSKPVLRSWAQIVRSTGQQSTEKVPLTKPLVENKAKRDDEEFQTSCVEEDKMALVLGKHLHELVLDFKPVCLQPRGLINRRNWCYINATLQALLASSPFYTLIRNLPLGPGVERGKSATPVIDSMVKVTYEFSQMESSQEELQLGQPFQPDFIYDMLRDLKSDCLKGQQEDAEEFLSFILNSMHEEMVKVIKNYEQKNCIGLNTEVKENGDLSDGEEEWQVIGSKHKGMVTRKVAEHKTPISDLLGGQIKSFLTTSGSKTSASIQPFFTLQLDIQSENVTSVSEALKEMTVKEPILGYTCAKTKQEVEAYSHISLQKLPPVLILHLKRFVYNKNGGCKKVMKKTDYPLELELSRDLFSPDVKKSQRIRMYRLFAVMYHDGEEAIKGHYISDVYNCGSQTWIRCDDRQITAVTEDQVLSHSPPRVPYLLFYQES